MGRTKTATNILEARGRFKKNPQRRNKKEPIVKAAMPETAPEHLDERQAGCWAEIRKIVPPGVLTSADALAIEVVAVLLAEFRVQRAEFSAAHLGRMTTLMGRLGLDPSGRASLVVEQPADSGFDDL